MFPLRDTIRAWSFPIVNYAIIAVNVLIFLFEASLGTRAFGNLIGFFGLTPANLSLMHPWSLVTFLSSTFLHGSWFHLISNMWILYIFGDNIEDRMGSRRYLVFYLFSGVVAGFVHTYITRAIFGTQSVAAQIPTVGASGAIAGVLGAYFILYPRARVTTFIPLIFLPWLVDVPAALFIGIWFFSQLSSGLLSLGAYGAFGGIAWWAHIGGFIVGFLLARVLARPQRVRWTWYLDEYRLL